MRVYTPREVRDAQTRLAERLSRILAEFGMTLDSGSPLWFDGADVPEPGQPWRMKLSCGGASSSVEFTLSELDAFLEVRPPEVISAKLRRAVEALRLPRPQEHGLA